MGHSFYSCDWGTSNFRLRLVHLPSLEVTGELRTADGIDRLEGDDPGRFASYLVDRIDELPGPEDQASEIPLWISGMASSSIGWRELDYARLPFPLDGSGAIVAALGALTESRPCPVRLVSGLRSEDDVLRGEETEALGLLKLLGRTEEETLLILPGTHSKHLQAREGEISSLRTFMTGELYAILTQHSILRHTVEEPETLAGLEDAFVEGVRSGARDGLSGGLFAARTRQVLGGKEPRENGAYLSGLLLSAELEPAGNCGSDIFVAAAGVVGDMYRRAAAELGIERLETVDERNLELSVPAGHALLEKNFQGETS